MWGGSLAALLGLTVGWLAKPDTVLRSASAGASAAVVAAAPPARVLKAEPPLPRAAAPLPRAEAPLPEASSRPVVRVARQPATRPPAPAVQEGADAFVPVAAAPTAPPQGAGAVARPDPIEAAAAPPVVAPVGPEPAENMGVLFERFNRALAVQDHAQAQRHLQTIRASLPASSLARWRAEAWFAYQSGELEKARDTYLGLLGKLPGDENATLNLVTIEQQLQQPERARAVLEASLRHNQDSVALRAALARLHPGEAPR
ncbi:MAG TPA: hypothetical protein DCM06_05500 [Comamonadaceae bacterium]|nr:hypothetical protein [Comamonadaceae bacterium]